MLEGVHPIINNLNKNIIFLGRVNDSQKKYLFEKAALMVMPTINESKNKSIEGFGIAYLEAAFFSVPSIASNVGGTPEAVLDNITGKIINKIDDLYETIFELLNDHDKLKSLGDNARKRAKAEFSWEHITNKYLYKFDLIYNKK